LNRSRKSASFTIFPVTSSLVVRSTHGSRILDFVAFELTLLFEISSKNDVCREKSFAEKYPMWAARSLDGLHWAAPDTLAWLEFMTHRGQNSPRDCPAVFTSAIRGRAGAAPV
jgi:hypothetical protein